MRHFIEVLRYDELRHCNVWVEAEEVENFWTAHVVIHRDYTPASCRLRQEDARGTMYFYGI